jgi:hypothetical protein
MVKHAAVRKILIENLGELVTLTYKRNAGKVSSYDVLVGRINSSLASFNWPKEKAGCNGFFHCRIGGIQKIEKAGVVLFEIESKVNA